MHIHTYIRTYVDPEIHPFYGLCSRIVIVELRISVCEWVHTYLRKYTCTHTCVCLYSMCVRPVKLGEYVSVRALKGTQNRYVFLEVPMCIHVVPIDIITYVHGTYVHTVHSSHTYV